MGQGIDYYPDAKVAFNHKVLPCITIAYKNMRK